VKHHLDLGIILLPETNGALLLHDPRRSRPERDAHGFVFAIVVAAALAIVIVIVATLAVVASQVIATLTVTAAVILRDRDNLLSRRRWDLHPNLITHPSPQ
jgi:hypothetical protein